MRILEITVPGSFLKIGEEGPVQSEENRRRLDFLTSQFYEANVSLIAFDASSTKQRLRQLLEGRPADEEQKREIHAELTSKYLALDADLDCKTQDQINLETEARFKRTKWQNGELPAGFLRTEIVIHARAFVYALDAFGKTLQLLSDTPGCPGDLTDRHQEFRRAFPDLTSVSDSLQRVADRAKGLRREKQTHPEPFRDQLAPAAEGGIPALNEQWGTRYGISAENGHYSEVEVSLATMEKLRGILQRTMDAFSWEGDQQHLPPQNG
ncbi:MAG: hypothetical protein H7Z75_11465 [Ferruginibacter sp.]|nr:hypothetical protein [Cytophagales bacterium]